MTRLTVALLCASGAANIATASEASPIGKVVQMISDLQAKVIREGEGAQKTYEEFSEWCEDRARDLSHDMKTGTKEVESLQASIADSSAKMQELNAKIDDLAGSISVDEADLKAATNIRSKELADFQAEASELTETISMLERAVAILEREMAKGGASMVQVKNAEGLAGALSAMVQASMIGSADVQRITALAQTSSSSDDEEPGAPDAAVYESQSGNIVETLHGLLDKAESQLAAARETEKKNVHAFEMLEQSLKDEIRFADKDMDDSKKALAASSEAKATATGDLETSSKDLQADTQAKADLHQQCMSRAEDFEAETKSRKEELSALAKAKQIIVETTSGAESQSYSFVQLSSRTDLAGVEAVRAIRDLGRMHHSQALMFLAQRLSSVAHSGVADPFGKIKGLISDMITKLEDAAAADADHKAYCDKELKETNAKKDDKSAEVEKLSTKIDQMTSKSASLKDEVAALQKALSNLASAQAEMDKLRSSENEEYKQNSAEMTQGLEGVKMALKVLNEYYAKDSAHGSASGSSSGIIGLLEVCESDFSKNLAEIESAEESAAAAYEQETKDNDLERTTKSKDAEYKAKEATRLDKDSAALSSDRKNVQAELDAVLEYLSDVEAKCAEKVETYAERKARREAEIAGLKSALETLEDETAFVQKKDSHRRFRGSKAVGRLSM